MAISALKVHELVPLLSQVDLSLQHKDGLQVCPGQTRLTYMTSEELKKKSHIPQPTCVGHTERERDGKEESRRLAGVGGNMQCRVYITEKTKEMLTVVQRVRERRSEG